MGKVIKKIKVIVVARLTERDEGCRHVHAAGRLHECSIYDSNVVVLLQIYLSGYVFSSVQSLAHHDLCSGSLLHVEAVHRVAAAAGPGCDAAASMPQPETLLEKSSSLVLQ